MKHHNQLRSGSLLTYVQMTLNIIVSIAYTPFMLRILGKSEYGLYSTVASTIAILSVLSLGFGGSYVRYYILYRKEKADDKIARLNGLFLIVFSVIGLIALACGLYLTFHLEMVFKTGLTDAEYHTARILMLLLTANLAVSFPMSVFSNIISAQEQFVFLKATEILRTVVSPLVTLPVLLAGILFGPWAGFVVGMVADIIGGVLAGYAINPLITLGAGAIGLVAGLAWQKLPGLRTGLRLQISVLLGHFVGSMVITSLALRIFYGYPWATLAVRIPNALILAAVNTVLLRILLENRALMKMVKK